jgi:hypothetical protein
MENYIVSDFIKSKCKDIITNFSENKKFLVSADCQSGKTNFAISMCAQTILEGHIPIVITRRLLDDMSQFICRCKDYTQDLESSTGYKIRTLGDIDNTRDLENAFTKKTPYIIVCIGTINKLSTLEDMIVNVGAYGDYTLIIDEIDNVDYGTCSKAGKSLSCLKKNAYAVIGITATPLDVIMSEENLTSTCQVRLISPDDYRGFRDIQVTTFDDKVVAPYNNTRYSHMTRVDSNLPKWLDKMSREQLWYDKKSEINLNVVMLLKYTIYNYNQETLYNSIKRKYPGLFVLILYNGKGIMCSENVGNFKANVYSSDLSINKTLQYFRMDPEKYPRILIIAGNIASRCISFVSNDYSLHLNHMYYLPQKSTTVPEMIQSVGRLCGRNRDKGPIHLCTPLKVARAVFSGYHFTNEIIDRGIKFGSTEESFKDTILNIKMSKEKMPKGRRITNKVKLPKKAFNLVNGKDGGENISTYKWNSVNNESRLWSRETTSTRRLVRLSEETHVAYLRRSIKTHVEETGNVFKTAREWQDITGLCGFERPSSYHYAVMTTLVQSKFLIRDSNKVKLNE